MKRESRRSGSDKKNMEMANLYRRGRGIGMRSTNGPGTNKQSADRQEQDMNKVVKKNFVKVFIFLFIIMIAFMIYSRIAEATGNMDFNAFPFTPDTDTCVRLEWSSVPGAMSYRVFRNDGNGEVEAAYIDVDAVQDPLSHNDANLRPNTQYTYTIMSYSDAGGTQLLEGRADEAITKTTEMIRPYGLQAIYDINSMTVILTWNHSALAEGSKINLLENGKASERYTSEKAATEEKVYGPYPVRFTIQSTAESKGYGVSAASGSIIVTPITAPTISAEYVNEGFVKVSWDNSRYIQAFNLETSRWVDADSSWTEWTTLVSSLSGSSSTSTVEIGGKYRYRLSAKDGSGYKGVSNITDFVSNLATPTKLKANIISNGRIDLSWTNAPGNEGKLQIWRKVGGTKDTETYTLMTSLDKSATSYSDLFTLVPGTVYHYKINAADDSGHYSAVAYVGITADVPIRPDSLMANVISASGITLLWSDDSDNESGFKIERFDEDSMKFTEVGTVGTNIDTYTDTNVVTGKSYVYRIRGYNTMGNSPYSKEITVNAWDPSAPTMLSVTPASSSRIDLSWNYAGTGNYNTIIERKSGAEGTWTAIYTTAAGTLKYSDTGLSPNTRYFYRIRKSLGTGASGVPYPNNSIGIGTYTLLGDIHLSAEASANNSIYLSWSGNVSEADIVVERKMPNGSFSALTTVSYKSRGWHDNTGLVPGASYTYRVMARTVSNESLYSNELSVRNYYLEAPTSLSLFVDSDMSVNLSWTDNSVDEAGFEIWRYTYGRGTYALYAVVDKNVTSFVDADVQKGTEYGYLVRAFVTENGPYSSFSNSASKGVGFVSPPVNIRYKLMTNTQILLQWTDTSDNEDGFSIERKIGHDGSWTTFAWLSHDSESYKITGLNKNTVYYFRVRAYKNSENSDFASEEIRVSFTFPDKPSNLIATSVTSSQIRLSWRNNSISEVTFKIMRSITLNGKYAKIAEVDGDLTTYLDNSVRADTNYYYKVAAVNAIGESESPVISIKTNTRVKFTDTKGVPWAEEAIENMAGMGIIKGVTDTMFMPSNIITRAEFTAMIVRAFKLDTAPIGSLADVKSNKWYYREVMIAENLGIISGDANNRFYPDSPITREDIALIIFRALEVSDRKYSLYDNSVLEKFVDKDNISPYAVSSMATLVGEGIIEGLQGNAVGPKYAATRAQAAVFLYRAITKTEPVYE